MNWAERASSPTTTDAFLYDGAGTRVEQQVTRNGVTTTTAYVGNLEEVATAGSTSTTTTYYYAGSLRIALAVGGPATGTVSYLGTDALGSSTVALSASGSETAAQLYDPYGNGRYSSGAIPTDYAYTGQHSDAATGLDYYNARYYDPLAGQFTSADTKQGPNRFAYVADDPETLTDPTGQRVSCPDPHDGCGAPPPGNPPGNGGGGNGSGSGGGNDTCNASCFAHYHRGNGSGGNHALSGVDPCDHVIGMICSPVAKTAVYTPSHEQAQHARDIAAEAAQMFRDLVTDIVSSGFVRDVIEWAIAHLPNPFGFLTGFLAGVNDLIAEYQVIAGLFEAQTHWADSDWQPWRVAAFGVSLSTALTAAGSLLTWLVQDQRRWTRIG